MKIKLSLEYMSESYDQARKYGSKWIVIELVVGLSFILAGIGLFIYTNGESVVPLFFLAIGVFELLSNKIKKYFWLRRHAKSKIVDAEVEVQVTDTGIESIGPFSSGNFQWGGIEKAVRTPEGILLWPQKGVICYFPENVMGKEIVDFIESKTV